MSKLAKEFAPENTEDKTILIRNYICMCHLRKQLMLIETRFSPLWS